MRRPALWICVTLVILLGIRVSHSVRRWTPERRAASKPSIGSTGPVAMAPTASALDGAEEAPPSNTSIACKVEGRVTSEDGVPRAADLFAREMDLPDGPVETTRAGDDGGFALTLQPGHWHLHAEAEGLISDPEWFDLDPGRTQTVDLVLRPSAIVWGFVQDPAGERTHDVPAGRLVGSASSSCPSLTASRDPRKRTKRGDSGSRVSPQALASHTVPAPSRG